jgi:AraC family transcriptional regulator
LKNDPARVVNEKLADLFPRYDPRVTGSLTRRDGAAGPITSQSADWPGVVLQAGTNDVVETDELTASHHFVSHNAGDRPFTLEVKGRHGYRPVTALPGSIWVAPAGEPVTLRLDSDYSYVRLMIAPRLLDRLLSQFADGDTPIQLRTTYGINAPAAAYVIRALAAESDGGNSNGLAYVEALTMAVGRQLAVHAGVSRPRKPRFRGGLSPVARRRVLELIDAKLDARLTTTALAREAGLSPAHFARAFREATGCAPHRYLVARRLQRARLLLGEPGATISDVALRTGFADQPHLTRLFRREFGVTPGTYQRARRG